MSTLPIFAGLAIPAKARVSWRGNDLSWSNNVPPIFCTAYIDPRVEWQKDQESVVAKYPLALVPQSMRRADRAWRDRIKSMNPDIKLAAYQMVIEETTVPGPGHDILRRVKNSWVTYPGGYTPMVKLGPNKYRRIFDPRKEEWQSAFIEACNVTIHADNFGALFLDQCSVFDRASPFPSQRAEMLEALRTTLRRLRKTLPHQIILGNSSYDFEALNGELNENRPRDLANETSQRRNTRPKMELFQYRLKSPEFRNEDKIIKMCQLAYKHECYFGVTNVYQRVIWPSFFDDIVKEFRI